MSQEHDPIMCIGLGCPARERCWRCRGVSPENWKRWFNHVPYDFTLRRCTWYISLHRQAAFHQPRVRWHR